MKKAVKHTRENWLPQWPSGGQNQRYLNSGKSSTMCKCPKCGECHENFLRWTGRGMPRIYCSNCRPLAHGIDDMSRQLGSTGITKGARKGTDHCFE